MPTVPPHWPGQHPAWCDRKHAPEWRVHTGLIGRVHFPGLTLTAELVDDTEGHETRIRLTFVTDLVPLIVELWPEPADVLRTMLGRGLQLQGVTG